LQKFAGWLLRQVSFVVIHLPQPIFYGLGDLLGILWFDVFRIRRRVVTDNLAIAFPEMSLEERKKLGRASLCNMGRDLMEYCYLPFMDRAMAERLFEIEGEEVLKAAQQAGRPVCLLTLHMGNGDLGSAGLSAFGYPMVLISKEFKMKWVNDIWFGMRERAGTEFIPPRNSTYAVLKALKKNKFVIFVLDQFTGPPIGLRTKFFGKETGTGYGLATMAQRTGAQVIPVYTVRKNDGKHLIRVFPEIEFKQDVDNTESLRAATQRYNDFIESVVSDHPEQWMWVHKRWKTFREPKKADS
jgi:KDO2-lipid IV(A) lauroyltransferase